MRDRNELEQLLDFLVGAAKFLQQRNGSFYPIGATINNQGEVVPSAAYEGDETPDSTQMIASLENLYSTLAAKEEIRAAAICMNVSVPREAVGEMGDAIQISLEHVDGESLNVFLPYAETDAGMFAYGQAFASRRARSVFRNE